MMGAPLHYPQIHRRGRAPVAVSAKAMARLEVQAYAALFTLAAVLFLFEAIAGVLTRGPA